MQFYILENEIYMYEFYKIAFLAALIFLVIFAFTTDINLRMPLVIWTIGLGVGFIATAIKNEA